MPHNPDTGEFHEGPEDIPECFTCAHARQIAQPSPGRALSTRERFACDALPEGGTPALGVLRRVLVSLAEMQKCPEFVMDENAYASESPTTLLDYRPRR